MPRKKIYRAGLICYYLTKNNNIEMLFMEPSNPKFGTSAPQLAKGKIEENETAKQAAIREAQEEVGLKTDNIIGSVDQLGVFLGRTTMFVAQIKNKDDFGPTCDETGATCWLTYEQFKNEGRGLHKPVVKQAVFHIKNLHGIP